MERLRVLREAEEILENTHRKTIREKVQIIRSDTRPRNINVLPIPTGVFMYSLNKHLIGDRILRSFAATSEPDPNTPIQSEVLNAFRKRKVIESNFGTITSTLERVTLSGPQIECVLEFAWEVGDTYVHDRNKTDHGYVVTFAEELADKFLSSPVAEPRNPLKKLVSRLRRERKI